MGHHNVILLGARGQGQEQVTSCFNSRRDEQIGSHAPKRCTMTNYLRKHKAKWEYASKDRQLQDPEPPKNREFRNLKNATIRAARELYYAPIYISQLQDATTEAQLNMIMRTARQHSYEEDL